ncbi:MAG: hypothetical protein ACLFV6_10960 [Spirulinaceae cyanobacterium]
MNLDFLLKWGRITFDELSSLEDSNLNKSIDSLKEDMLQVELVGNYLLDIGWYPSFDLDGEFRLILIKEHDWDRPIYSGTAKDILALREKIEQSLEHI